MNTITRILVGLMMSSLFGQHYPFPHDKSHSVENSSNCRAYAMARAFYGNYCPATKLGRVNFEEPPVFIIKPWDGDVAVGDIALWGSRGETHAAYIVGIYGQNFGLVFVDQMPAPDYELGPDIHKSLDWVRDNTQAVGGFNGYNGDQDKIGYPNYYAKRNDNTYWKLTVKNQLWDGSPGGTVKVNDQSKSSKYSKFVTWGTSHKLEAEMDGALSPDGYKHNFIKWKKTVGNENKFYTNKILTVYLTDDNLETSYTAIYNRTFEVTVKNEFTEVGNMGSLVVNDTNRTMPFSTDVVVDNSITVSAPLISQTYDHIDYEFIQWSTGDENHTITITPESNMTITAHYRGYPRSMAHYGLTSGTIIGDNIKLTWNVHPNQNVSRYDIYRKIKPKLGPWGGRIKITSVNRNATSWIDPQYILTNGYSDDLLLYDVSPFYSTESTNAKIDWTVSFGEDFDSDDFFKKRENEQYSTPNEFNLKQSHPNPFNPTTTIKYELPVASSVSIIIYDIRGNEVKTWESGNESPGFKQIAWQATDSHGNKVPAGIYIYKLTAISHETKKVFSKSMKMVLLK